MFMYNWNALEIVCENFHLTCDIFLNEERSNLFCFSFCFWSAHNGRIKTDWKSFEGFTPYFDFLKQFR